MTCSNAYNHRPGEIERDVCLHSNPRLGTYHYADIRRCLDCGQVAEIVRTTSFNNYSGD